MSGPVYVMPTPLTGPAPVTGSAEVADLLRQLLAAQRELVALHQAQAASQDPNGRWKSFLARWAEEFPNVGGACKRALPALERAYIGMINEATERLAEEEGLLASEFALAEFLDRYGMKLAQMGNIINQLSPLADASSASNKS
ncbi:hypothetical protein R5W23_005895 [Gemmata sp. JC673]|uniref:Uncharacterized protein n=1 Tax=Gemmata algarum TaxID=2975278 RepID=A0ABU5ETV5_9BACT|nr:hypothetical protein [Gemmata algarum]MDY3558738.1 hypothetical protein [Gemmata algarum]